LGTGQQNSVAQFVDVGGGKGKKMDGRRKVERKDAKKGERDNNDSLKS
jgi:hypothetical protein